jgi:HD-GYP domain-containing protein (c-di-GMP phosphodiesterase class II)
MTLELTFEEQEVLADSRRRAVEHRTTLAEVVIEVLIALGFMAAVGALFWIGSPQPLELVGAILSALVLLVATRVEFEMPFGFTVATQLAFVPLLFVMPGALVPITVAVVLAASAIPGVVSGRMPARRLLRSGANAWFSVGPALVFAIADVRPDHAGPLILLAALAAQVGVDFCAGWAYVGLVRSASFRSQLGECWVYVLDAALAAVGLVVAEEMHASPYAVLAMLPLLGLLHVFANERGARLEKLLELNDTYRGTAVLLGDVITADDGYTGEHSQGVVELALSVADALGVAPDRRRNLEFGAMLHDVGKIVIPKAIINKPGKLTAEEWDLVKTHPAEGERMLKRVGGFMVEVGKIVRHHHERWDGGGYPDGLAGEDVPLESRIIVCCDSWSAMRTDRAYRAAMSYEAAIAEMVAGSGAQFDPAVLAAMLPLLAATEGPGATVARVETTPPLLRPAEVESPRSCEPVVSESAAAA